MMQLQISSKPLYNSIQQYSDIKVLCEEESETLCM